MMMKRNDIRKQGNKYEDEEESHKIKKQQDNVIFLFLFFVWLTNAISGDRRKAWKK